MEENVTQNGDQGCGHMCGVHNRWGPDPLAASWEWEMVVHCHTGVFVVRYIKDKIIHVWNLVKKV